MWNQVVALLPADHHIDRSLNDLRQKTLGNLPKSRDAIKVDKILEQLHNDGGKHVKLLDSNEMWQDPEFRQQFSEEFQNKGVPERAMLFTTDKLLEQMSIVTRWSVDGTHRVTPKHFSQLFIAMMKVSEKWIPGVYELLPSHKKESYRSPVACHLSPVTSNLSPVC